MEEETLTKLNENIDRLNHNIERQTSFKFLILKGLVYGVSVVIGTTILAGILFSLFNLTFGSAENIPLIGDFAEEIPETQTYTQ